jgi:protein SCO1/2
LTTVIAARVRLTLIAATMIALAALAGVLLAGQKTSGAGLELHDGWAGAQRPPGQPVPAFAIRTATS